MRRTRGASLLSYMVVLVCALVILAGDAILLRDLARQFLATRYPSATGTITQSGLKEFRTNKGPTYQLAVAYTYEAGGQTHQGTRFRYPTWSTGDRVLAEELVRRYPTGAQVKVFHAPGDPSNALLEPGVRGADLFFLLVLLPFNLLLAMGAGLALHERKHREEEVQPFIRNNRTHVRLDRAPPALAGAVASAGGAVVFTIIVGLATRFEPSLTVALLSWATVVVAGLCAARWKRARLDAGHYDLVFDTLVRRLSLPAMSVRKERLDLPWAQVQAVTVEPHTRPARGGTQTCFRPTLVLASEDGSVRKEAIVEYDQQTRAEALAEWLRASLKLRSGA